MSRLIVPAAVAALLERLRSAGFAAYVVGGCVRDSLRGVAPADWDVTTAATPEQVLALFSDCRTYGVGQRHGTVAVLTDEGGVEITTFRRESGYSDRRHPDGVEFVRKVTEDLRRRDFTVNAMAYNDAEGLIDPFGGEADLAAGRLRCVGEAKERFQEDALRILRGLRFAATLGFSIEKDTAEALHQCRDLLREVAAERVAAELNRLLCGQAAETVLREFRDVIAVVLPVLAPAFDFDQRTPYHIYDVYEHTLHALSATPPDPILRWAVLLHDTGKPACCTVDENGVGHFRGHAEVSAEQTRTTLKDLRMDTATVETVTELVLLHDRPILPTAPAVKRVLNRIGEKQLRRLFAVKRADNAAHAPGLDDRIVELEAVEKVLDDILRQESCFSLKDLAVKGKNITEIGVPEGPLVGQILHQLLEEVMDGRIENDYAPLIRRASAIFEEVNRG